MEYHLDDRIVFNPEDNTLMSKDDPEQRVDITLTASRLLLLLIRHQGEVLTRDAIMKAVWEYYGLNPSNSSLNQYISVLRGVFRSLGLDGGVIETVPRIGFMLRPELAVQGECQSEVTVPLLVPPGNVVAPQAAPDSASFRRPSRNLPGLLLASLMLSVLIALVYLNYILQTQAPYALAFESTAPYRECRVLTLPMYEHDNNLPTQALLTELITTSGLTCAPGGELYVHIDGNVAHGKKGKAWVSSCERRTGDGSLQCRDYLSNDWSAPQ